MSCSLTFQDENNQNLTKTSFNSLSALSLDAKISAYSLDQLLVVSHADARVEEVADDHGDQVALVMAVTQSNGG